MGQGEYLYAIFDGHVHNAPLTGTEHLIEYRSTSLDNSSTSVPWSSSSIFNFGKAVNDLVIAYNTMCDRPFIYFQLHLSSSKLAQVE